jgi:hypothetical protein
LIDLVLIPAMTHRANAKDRIEYARFAH